jgi:hypothetical protein
VDLGVGLDDVEKRKFLTLPGLELRPFGRPARSQLLCRLRYPGSYSGALTELDTLPQETAKYLKNVGMASNIIFHIIYTFTQKYCLKSSVFLDIMLLSL